jgi:hypothetical protein
MSLKLTMSNCDEDKRSTGKKVGKKIDYPFGTPSHFHHAYSEFAHIHVDNRNFAINLATATDILPEVIEKKLKRRKIPIKTIVRNDIDGDESQASEESQTCTKIACQQIVRAIEVLNFRNQMEKIDLEDEYEQNLEDLRLVDQDEHLTESRLDKLTDIGNSLEVSSNKLLHKVETLKKMKENLLNERNDISSKVSLSSASHSSHH